MPRTNSGAGPGQIPLFSIFLDLVPGRSGASSVDGTRHDFV